MSENEHNLLTVKETAQYLNIPLPTVYFHIQRGQIPAIQIAGRWRIKRSALEAITQTEPEKSPAALVLIHEPALRKVLVEMLRKCGWLASGVSVANPSLIVCDASTSGLDILGAIDANKNAAVVLLWGEHCPATLWSILRWSPVTLLNHPVQLSDVERLARMFGVQPQAPIQLAA